MAKVNSKAKGSSFERDISKLLSEIYNTPKGFSRSAGSGNRFGGKNSVNLNIHNRQSSKAQLGDIQTPDSIDLIVECKSYKEFTFHHILQGSCKVLDTWLDQLITDRGTFEKVFNERLPVLLFFKINMKGTYIAVPKTLIKKPCRKIVKIEYIFKDEVYCIFDIKIFRENKELIKSLVKGTNV